MNAAHQRRLTPVLAATAVVLALLWLALWSGVGRGVHWDAARPPAPLPPAGQADGLPQPVPLQEFAQVWQQPLFSPDRKPVARAVDGGSSLGDLDLTGIILTPHLRMALLHDRNGDRQVRLVEGASLPDGSVTLVEVRVRSAVFDAPSGRTELKLPAGAPIHTAKPADGAADDGAAIAPPVGNASPASTASDGVRMQQGGDGEAKPPAPLTPTESPSGAATRAAVERLRQNIQRRRAAEAAAANAGVR